MKPVFKIAAIACLWTAGASAQELGSSMSAENVDILDMSAETAIIADRLGDKYVCDVTQRRNYAEIGKCKPIRLSERVGGYIEAQGKVLSLFERNDCSLTYAQLKSALANATEETRKSVGEIMTDMTDSGALVDDEARGRARLTTGDVCSK